jgi:antitoxin component YwqK of YwqJK toxin-antitoxin module
MKKTVLSLTLLLSLGLFSQEQEFNWTSAVNYEQVGPYCDTYKCGRWLTYYENGEVAMVETFDETGKLKGERVTFTTSGVIKHYTEWKEGVKVGKEIYFDEKGYPTQVIYHKTK